MIKKMRGSSLAAVSCTVMALAGCQSILPGDGPSRLALRQIPVVASSGQRLGPDGYPLLGDYPNAATAQIDTASVEAAKSELKAAGASRRADAASTDAAYRSKLAEMESIKAGQRRAVAEAAAPPAESPKARVSGSDPDAVLREIEGQR
ncbi:hypothetical protein ASG43_18510 [Aureimonas sp. Leaf454]|uniref:hypothetical protein n=1 Tax=Aureimonas sp. Leaf454 TaxID=1736381 RepID=UPI0006FF475F|nr:hypothetical protein [Aureimonas sp. Leaf454]KQT53219.1 hypothetical protein ASG43_18510 [Aureimonas sp. Leaf454]